VVRWCVFPTKRQTKIITTVTVMADMTMRGMITTVTAGMAATRTIHIEKVHVLRVGRSNDPLKLQIFLYRVTYRIDTALVFSSARSGDLSDV
jgi:hypothetical protein